MKTRLLLVDDHKVMLDGLKTLIKRQPDMEVVGTGSDGIQAMELAESLRPDIVIIDIGMPKLSGIEATKEIRRQFPEIKIIALSMHHSKRFITSMFRAGASAYLQKSCDIEELYLAIKTVAAGKTYMSKSIPEGAINEPLGKKTPVASSSRSSLSQREWEVLQFMSEGKTTKEIAGQLNITVTTVETHRRRLMNKLNIHNVAELTKYAIREGMTSLYP